MNAKEAKKIAEAFLEQGISTKTQFLDALPHLIEMFKAYKSAKEWFAIFVDVFEKFHDELAEYAFDHTSVFTRPMVEVKDGIISGEIDMEDGETLRLTQSKDRAKRLDGGNLTQAFLGNLDDKLVTTKLALRDSAVSALADDELAALGLYRAAKLVWTQVETKVAA